MQYKSSELIQPQISINPYGNQTKSIIFNSGQPNLTAVKSQPSLSNNIPAIRFN
jgi:hypothetical protein